MKHSHSLCYFIPAENGETAPGSRRLNWVWYWNVPEADLDELLTDRDGVRRSYAIAPGLLHPRQEERQREIAERVLAPPFAALVRATKDHSFEPFSTLNVHSWLSAKSHWPVMPPLSFGHTRRQALRRVSRMRSHSRSSWLMARMFLALNNWERSELVKGRQLIDLGQRLGNQSQFS
jgi:hypothetical protein